MGLKGIFPHARPDSEEAAPACAPCPPSLQQPRLGAAARPSSTSGLVSRAHCSRRFSIRRSRPPSHVLSGHRLSASSGIGRNPRQGRGVLSTPAQCTSAPYEAGGSEEDRCVWGRGPGGRQAADVRSEPGRGCFLREMESAVGVCATRSESRVSRVTGQSKVGAGTPVMPWFLFPGVPKEKAPSA